MNPFEILFLIVQFILWFWLGLGISFIVNRIAYSFMIVNKVISIKMVVFFSIFMVVINNWN
jgi:hypothetical protein